MMADRIHTSACSILDGTPSRPIDHFLAQEIGAESMEGKVGIVIHHMTSLGLALA